MLIKGSLIVSCQADQGSPFDNTLFIRAFAQAAKLGGAGALKIQGPDNIVSVRKDQTLPIIGFVKRPGFGDVETTPDIPDIAEVIQAGADIVAFDATLRKRPTAISAMIDFIHQHNRLAMAKISTAVEAIAALDAGADYVSTALSGYTNYSPKLEGPDLELISDLSMHDIEIIAEGRFRTPSEARAALSRGAFAVIVGSAITRPDVITSWFSQEMLKCSTIYSSETSSHLVNKAEILEETPVEDPNPYTSVKNSRTLEDLQPVESG
jgi:N-acylglucosamine-6-phosphate 2-epimerase